MPLLTEKQIRAMLPNAGSRLDAHLPYISSSLENGAINTPSRIAAFMAQASHESKELIYMKEIWGPTDAQLGYEGRADLGNDQPGDGYKFAGLGPFQITGRANQRAACAALGIPLAEHKKLGTPEYGIASACWFWNTRKLSKVADREWFRVTTRIINGGFNGWNDRLHYYQRNREILGLEPYGGQLLEDVDVRKFQRDHGLGADGVVGPKTLAKL